MATVKEQFLSAIDEWFPASDIATDPDQGAALRVRLSERVFVEELGKDRRKNPIIINASEDVLSDLSHMDEQQRNKALKTIGDFVSHQLSSYDDGLAREPYATTHPFCIDIPTSIY
jgi:hypothetical protein